MGLSYSKTCLAFLREHEGLKLNAYANDGSGKWQPTIGIGCLLLYSSGKRSGHETSYPSPWNSLVKSLQDKILAQGIGAKQSYPDVTITEEQAYGLVAAEITGSKGIINYFNTKYNASSWSISDNQSALIIDLAYQYGRGGAPVVKACNAINAAGGNANAASNEILSIIETTKKYARRCESRKKLWQGTWTPTQKTLDSVNGFIASGGGSFDASAGDASAGFTGSSGVSKWWYLGAAHNILNNNQLEKLYVELKLRGCNLSILRGEKVPVLLMDNHSRANIMGHNNIAKDPTLMLDTWASGWFIIGGYSLIYDPVKNNNKNKWTTLVKLQRMEWPTPEAITDPSTNKAIDVRYDIAATLDSGTSVLSSSRIDASVVSTQGLKDYMTKLVTLMKDGEVGHELVSGRRWVLDEKGRVVRDEIPAFVEFQGAYAVKTTKGIQFFSDPVSSHLYGEAIDIVNSEKVNYSKLLANILENDKILIHMYNNGLALCEETGDDDLGVATSHYHIGTERSIQKPWWESVKSFRGTWSIGGYNFADYMKNAKLDRQANKEALLQSGHKTVSLALNEPTEEGGLSFQEWQGRAASNAEIIGNFVGGDEQPSGTATKDSSTNATNSTVLGQTTLTLSQINSVEFWESLIIESEDYYRIVKTKYLSDFLLDRTVPSEEKLNSIVSSVNACLAKMNVITTNVTENNVPKQSTYALETLKKLKVAEGEMEECISDLNFITTESKNTKSAGKPFMSFTADETKFGGTPHPEDAIMTDEERGLTKGVPLVNTKITKLGGK